MTPKEFLSQSTITNTSSGGRRSVGGEIDVFGERDLGVGGGNSGSGNSNALSTDSAFTKVRFDVGAVFIRSAELSTILTESLLHSLSR